MAKSALELLLLDKAIRYNKAHAWHKEDYGGVVVPVALSHTWKAPRSYHSEVMKIRSIAGPDGANYFPM